MFRISKTLSERANVDCIFRVHSWIMWSEWFLGHSSRGLKSDFRSLKNEQVVGNYRKCPVENR